jgi:hypothetical protein
VGYVGVVWGGGGGGGVVEEVLVKHVGRATLC